MALYDPYDTGYTDYVTRMMRKKSLGLFEKSRSFGADPTAPVAALKAEPPTGNKTFLYLAIGAILAVIFLGKKKG